MNHLRRLRLRPRMHRWQSGVTLIELMVAMTLSSAIILSCCALFLIARHSNQQIDASVQLQEDSRFALAIVARTIRQANYAAAGPIPAAIIGYDNARYAGKFIQANGANNSDLISITHTGSGNPADGTIRNCGGVAVAANAPSVSSFFAAFGSASAPELTCRYKSGGGDNTPIDALVPIESLQFLYAIDSDGDGIPNQILSASNMTPARWPQVVAVRIAIVVRSREVDHIGAAAAITYHLFGPVYSNLRAASDRGAVFTPAPDNRGYIRQVFNTTVWLRQSAS